MNKNFNSIKSGLKKGGKSAFSYFEKDPKKSAKLVLWGVVILVIAMFGKKIYDMISNWFADEPTEEEKAKAETIKQIKYNSANVNLNPQQVSDRIAKIKSALTGVGSDEKKVFEALTRWKPLGFKYQDLQKVKDAIPDLKSFNPVTQLSAQNLILSLRCNLLTEYKSLPEEKRLNYDEVRCVVKNFGTQPWGIISTTHGTLQDWVRDEEEGEEFAFFWEMMKRCNLD